MNDAPQKTEGVGNAGCATHPQPRVRNKAKHTSVVTARFAGITRHSRTQWFYGLYRALPGERIRLVTVIREYSLSKPGRADAPPRIYHQQRVPEPHGFAVRGKHL